MHQLQAARLSFPFAALFLFSATVLRAQPQAATKPSDSIMAPLQQYLLPDANAEIALARSSAPDSIAHDADVMVLTRTGYTTAVKGTNGFVCMVERSWAKPTDDPEFWSPKILAPNCFNPAAVRTFLPIYLLKTTLALAGKSNTEILRATDAAFKSKALPQLEPGAMCYMMSPQQYLSDGNPHWHPHLMFFVSGDAEKSWGANLPGSPLVAGNDPEERVTVMMMMASHWSDGTPNSPTH